MFQYLLFLIPTFANLCSEIDIGTDISAIGNIVKNGKVQQSWSPKHPTNIYSSAQSEVYFYVKGFDLLGPRFDVESIHFENEDIESSQRWLVMSVSLDEEINGILKDYRAFKVSQICADRADEASLQVNITFKAHTCDRITFSWIKVCGETGSFRNGLNLGLKPGSAEVVGNGVVKSSFDRNLVEDNFVIPTDQNELVLFMSFTETGIRTFFKPPSIITDHEIMYPKLSGNMTEAISIYLKPLVLKIKFNCKVQNGASEEIMLLIELPYYKNLEIHFYKDCGLKKEAKITLIVLTAIGMTFLLIIMWMHASGRTEKTGELYQKFKNSGTEALKRMIIMAGLKYKDFRRKQKSQEDIHTLYGTI